MSQNNPALKPTVSVLISAYNEELTLPSTIQGILNQNETCYSLKEILVISDGSTDKTAEVTAQIKDPRIKLIVSETRKGKAFQISMAVKICNSDITIFMDADILISTNDIFNDLIKPFSSNPKLGVVCGAYDPLPPRNWLQRVATTGHLMYIGLKDHLSEKAMMHRCVGRLFATRTSISRTVETPGDVASDMFYYYAVMSKGYSGEYVPQAQIFYAIPSDFKEYIIQNSRHLNDGVEKYFPALYSKHKAITFKIKSVWFLKNFIWGTYSRWNIFLFGCLYTIAYIRSLLIKKKVMWKESVSSKESVAHFAHHAH